MKKDFQAGRLTTDDIIVIKEWVEQVETYGPDSLRQVWGRGDRMNPDVLNRELRIVNLWNDHDLDGHLKGCRSSSFSRLGRIIYKVVDNKIQIIEILKVTPDHKY
ncbi:hypothetical protein [Bdellovibrio sp. BCCA]|uniref:hypothetical protein n=1 Tax=Bdellovibrio sp. BCCA TaxID=3136281 RepID=UPI0030EFB0E9